MNPWRTPDTTRVADASQGTRESVLLFYGVWTLKMGNGIDPPNKNASTQEKCYTRMI
jgi:hypothetical protein